MDRNLTADQSVGNVDAALARIEGRLAVLDERQSAGAIALNRLIDLLRDQIMTQNAEIGKVAAEVHEYREQSRNDTSIVRVQLEKRIEDLDSSFHTKLEDTKTSVFDLKLSWAKATGLATAGGIIASLLVTAAMKGLGL